MEKARAKRLRRHKTPPETAENLAEKLVHSAQDVIARAATVVKQAATAIAGE